VLVLDASAMVDLLIGAAVGVAVAERIEGEVAHAPGHFDAEVLSALGRLHRAGLLSAPQVGTRLARLEEAPIERHPLVGLSRGAWAKRANLRLADALYVELAARLGVPLLTTDAALAAADRRAELVAV
jgi:predicted nucleic acid-binding protein